MCAYADDQRVIRENWKYGEESHARGAAWLNELYLHNINPINEVLAAHKDFSTCQSYPYPDSGQRNYHCWNEEKLLQVCGYLHNIVS